MPAIAGATLLTLPGERGPVYALHAPGDPTVALFLGNAEQLADEAWEIDPIRAPGGSEPPGR